MSDSDDFWEGCRRGQLVIQACRTCGRSQHFPRARCHFCMGNDLESRPSSGRGTLLTYSTVYRAPTPEFVDLVPYTLGIVRLDEEGVQLMARILAPEEELSLDMPVTVDFYDSPLGPTMPGFRPAKVAS
jgi:hypothetical protein